MNQYSNKANILIKVDVVELEKQAAGQNPNSTDPDQTASKEVFFPVCHSDKHFANSSQYNNQLTRQESPETVFLIAICPQLGDKWQSKLCFSHPIPGMQHYFLQRRLDTSTFYLKTESEECSQF